MTIHADIGILDKSRELENIYVGVNNIARLVEDGFIGVLNIANTFYWNDENEDDENEDIIVTSIEPLSVPRTYHISFNLNNNIVVAGGIQFVETSTVALTTEIYNSSLVKSLGSTPALPIGNLLSSLPSFGILDNKAIIVQGGSLSLDYSEYITICNNDLSFDTISATRKRNPLVAKINDEYILSGGGVLPSDGYGSNLVECYDKDLTCSTLANLSYSASNNISLSVKNHAIFLGGYGLVSKNTVPLNIVDIYNDSLTKIVATTFPRYITYASAVSLKSHAAVIGGWAGNTAANVSPINSIYYYDEDLILTLLPSGLTFNTLNAISVASDDNETAIITGGTSAANFSYIFAESYMLNNDMILTNIEAANIKRVYGSGANMNDYILFFGGRPALSVATTTDVVDVYSKDGLTHFSSEDI